MEYEIFLNKVRKNLEKTDNYFECEMNEIIDVIRNTLTNEKIINISDIYIVSKILTIKPFYFDLHTLHLTSSSVCSESSSLKPLVQGFVFLRKYIKL